MRSTSQKQDSPCKLLEGSSKHLWFASWTFVSHDRKEDETAAHVVSSVVNLSSALHCLHMATRSWSPGSLRHTAGTDIYTTAVSFGSSPVRMFVSLTLQSLPATPHPCPKDTNLILPFFQNELHVNNRAAVQMLKMEIAGISLTRLIILLEIMDFKWNSSSPRRAVIIHDQTPKWNQNLGNMQSANFLHQWNLSSSYWLIWTGVWLFNW